MSWAKIRPAQPPDTGAVERSLFEIVDTTDCMPGLHSNAEDISFVGSMIDQG